MQPAAAPALDIDQIQQLIPHRPPFLWVDEVLALSQVQLHARKFVTPDLDVFQGHYPGFAILPGVLQCEALFQAGAVLIAAHTPPADGQVPVVTRLNHVQFRGMVRPGETLDLEVELTDQVANAYFLKGKASVMGKVTVRLEFACAATTPEEQ